MDNYLEIARKVLREAGQPLSAKQILRTAYQLQIVPRELYGRTQHKTLQARLSTEILKLRARSEFYRTGPGRFFLRSLQNYRESSTSKRKEYLAPLRAAQLGRFEVAAFSRNVIESLKASNGLTIAGLFGAGCSYNRMDDVRRMPDILALRIVVILVHEGRMLLRQRRPLASGEMPSRTAIGFDGVARHEDRSLFSSDDFGLSDAAFRTIAEWLKVAPVDLQHLQPCHRIKDSRALYEIDETPADDDLTVLLSYDCTEAPKLLDVIKNQETLDWHCLPMRCNDLDQFDRWSARLAVDHALQAFLCQRAFE